jgi:serine/threonine protein kinase
MRHAISEKSNAEPTSIQIVACNVIQLATAEGIELVRREIEAERILDGCRGCRRKDDDIGFDPARLVVHLYSRGLPVDEGFINLRTLMANPTEAKALTKANVFQIMASIVLALQDCHANGVVHGDIKPENSMSTLKQ